MTSLLQARWYVVQTHINGEARAAVPGRSRPFEHAAAARVTNVTQIGLMLFIEAQASISVPSTEK